MPPPPPLGRPRSGSALLPDHRLNLDCRLGDDDELIFSTISVTLGGYYLTVGFTLVSERVLRGLYTWRYPDSAEPLPTGPRTPLSCVRWRVPTLTDRTSW